MLPVDETYSPSIGSPSAFAEPEVLWRHYFVAKAGKNPLISKKRASTSDIDAIKRIFPDERHQPTLLMASSVVTSELEMDETSSRNGGSIHFGSRPATPLPFGNLFSSPPVTSPMTDESKRAVARPQNAVEDIQPRRSFSIGDLLSTGPSWKQRPATPSSGKFTRRKAKRSSSAPLVLPMGGQHSVAVQAEVERPSKRRDLTDPSVYTHINHPSQSSQITSNDETTSRTPSSPPSTLPPPTTVTNPSSTNSFFPVVPQKEPLPTDPMNVIHIPLSTTVMQGEHQTSWRSVSPSEQASTVNGYENEPRMATFGEEEETDFPSKALFGQIRTKGTRSISGARGPRIQTIFDDSPPGKSKVTALRDLLPKGTFRDSLPIALGDHGTIEDREVVSTPVHSVIRNAMNGEFSKKLYGDGKSPSSDHIPSSPPEIPAAMKHEMLDWDTLTEQDAGHWSLEDEERDSWSDNEGPISRYMATPSLLKHRSSLFVADSSSPSTVMSHHLTVDHSDRDKRTTIFDWSEQPAADRSPGNRTPPRPKTVHGKKDANGRGSRSVGRRAPSALHARSQSVPVVPDASGKLETVITNKFGTWGVGSKGVTEDWNDDFDFAEADEADAEPSKLDDGDEKRIDSGVAMFVPKSIREQQSNVLANIGLLREWGLLIEELKELRIRATVLGLMGGRYLSLWQEIDAMIDLADQEAEEPPAVPCLSPPSSPQLDLDLFDDLTPNASINGQAKRRSGLSTAEELLGGSGSVVLNGSRTRRKSILPGDDDIFSNTPSTASRGGTPQQTPHGTPRASISSRTRPRKDSEAVARSVIEALKRKTDTADATCVVHDVSPTKKVPFDTATLRHIVPYVNGLMRKVKDVLREAEGLYSSPQKSPPSQEPALSQLFQNPPNSSPSSRRARRPKNSTVRMHSDDSFDAKENELTAGMKLMTVM